tara:strand:- start:17 stop:1120 length:1104 start_codon:yes stop_codon:yes gene_type:complete
MKKIKLSFINKLVSKVKNFKLKSYKIKESLSSNFKEYKNIFNENYTKYNPTKMIHWLQDKIESSVKSDTNRVVLKQSENWAKSITWVLMGTTVFAIGWISIAKTDEIVIATGKLEPKGGVIDVQMPLEGITSEVLVREGELVKKGQVLITLDQEIVQAETNALQNNLKLNLLILSKLKNLVKEGAVSEMQYLEKQAQIENIQSQITKNLVRLKYQKIISPANGMVFELKPKGPGFVAASSQPVMKIVPSKNLIAAVEIDSRTIGFVEKGKSADISIDSFPASDFGVIEGTISSIGSDALPPIPSLGKGYRFPAKIILNNQYLKHNSGRKLPLQAGMSLSANIKLRKVTYIQLLLNKFNDKVNSLKSI